MNYNYSLHMKRVFTQDWLNTFWIPVACRVLSFISQGKLSDEYTWTEHWIHLSSRILCKYKQVVKVLLFMYFICICPCSVVVAFLIVYSLFYTDVIGIFLFIRWSRKQIHCFVFVYHFNDTISIFVITLRDLGTLPCIQYSTQTLRVFPKISI